MTDEFRRWWPSELVRLALSRDHPAPTQEQETQMASQVDLGPAANQVAALVNNTSDEQMSAPTPCPAYTVGDLLDHFVGLTREFTNAAAKRTRRTGSNGTQADAGS